MNYPFWDISMGYGPLMAVIAIIHVFVSHFAIGGGLYLVVTEHFARKRNDTDTLDYLQRLSKYFVLITVVFGALTGVGIWFIIGLLNPAATEMLIHNFVWVWATEWTFFIVEILASLLYFYGWRHMSGKDHLTLGWIYFVAAWLSLFAINGIITFMLTPGDWLVTGDFWDSFFNPTFWPSLVTRTGICVMLAGLYAMLAITRSQSSESKKRIVRNNALWGLVGVAIIVPSLLWYVQALPESTMSAAKEVLPTALNSIHYTHWFAAGIAALLLFGIALPKLQNKVVTIFTMILALGWFSGFEMFRELIRKPYVITDYMYANAVEVSKVDDYISEGYLPHIAFRTGDDGADLFRHSCQSCHTIDGYRELKPAFDGTDKEFIAGVVRGSAAVKGAMPPFFGTWEESDSLAAYLYRFTDHRKLSEIYGVTGVELGEKVYQVRCGVCHEFGGYNDNLSSLTGLSKEEYDEFLESSGDIDDDMPRFSGDAAEWRALVQYLMTLKESDSAGSITGEKGQ